MKSCKFTSVRSYLLIPLILSCIQLYGQSSTAFRITRVNSKNQLPSGLVLDVPASVAPDAVDLSNWLTSALNANSDFQLVADEHMSDFAGNDHYKFTQSYKGFPVEGSMLRAHYKGGKLVAVNGDFYPGLAIDTRLRLSEAQALELALKEFPSNATFARQGKDVTNGSKISKAIFSGFLPKATLVLVSKHFSLLQSDFRLAYKFNIYALQPLARRFIYIDALNGALLGTSDLIHTIGIPGVAHTRYSGTQHIVCDSLALNDIELLDESRGQAVLTMDNYGRFTFDSMQLFRNNSREWDNVNAAQDEVATDVHWGLERTYDFYRDKLGRHSINDRDTFLAGIVHFGTAFSTAFWNGSFASFGDGDSNTFYPLTSLDICAHEISHGLTQYTAGLQYLNESGALNESFSDIFGKCVEHYADPAHFSWQIGNKVTCKAVAMRDMQNPNKTMHPKYYYGTYYYTGVDDNGGVHTNSGVQNYWFYLLCSGGSGVRESDGAPFTVKPLGWDKATSIAYTALAGYFTPWTTYSDAAYLSVDAAGALYGISSDEANQVQMAWYGVGLADKPVVEGIAEMHALQFQAYPNPVTGDIVHLSFMQPLNNACLRLVDITGKIVLQQDGVSGSTRDWDITQVSEGIYLLELLQDGAVSRIKIVK